MNQHLGVRTGRETVTPLFELRRELPIVVNLPVEDDPDGLVFVRHRLVAGFEIDDAEARHPDTEWAVAMNSAPIRSSVDEDLTHSLQRLPADGPARVNLDDSEDPAHGLDARPSRH